MELSSSSPYWNPGKWEIRPSSEQEPGGSGGNGRKEGGDEYGGGIGRRDRCGGLGSGALLQGGGRQ